MKCKRRLGGAVWGGGSPFQLILRVWEALSVPNDVWEKPRPPMKFELFKHYFVHFYFSRWRPSAILDLLK